MNNFLGVPTARIFYTIDALFIIVFISWLSIVVELAHSCGYFRELSCRFGFVRGMFGIPNRVTSLCLPALLEIFSFFLGGDVSVNVLVNSE